MRSLLFVPADNLRKLNKSLQSGADALIFDLEDSVSLSQKTIAREVLQQFLISLKNTDQQQPLPCKIYVRVNALDTDMTLADLCAVMPYQPDGIVLPKSKGADDIQRLAYYLDAFEAQQAPGSQQRLTKIIAIATETAGALAGLESYRSSTPRLEALMWGAEDLSGDIGAFANKESDGKTWTPTFEFARTRCLLAATAAGISAIDCVPTDIHNLEALKCETERAYRDGFTAKAAIHPSQIATINQAMMPSAEQQTWAQKVVEAFENSDTVGVATLDGKMLDMPHLSLARKILSASKLSV